MPEQWFVVQTEPMREKTVDAYLRRDGFQPYLPRCRPERNSKVYPLFPGYLFVPIADHWYRIRQTIGVRALLMSGPRPAHIPHRVIAELRRREGKDGLVRLPARPAYRRGQRVAIVKGPFQDRTAIYLGMSAHERERVLVQLLGQYVEVDLPPHVLAPPN